MKWLCYHVSVFKQILFLIQVTLSSLPSLLLLPLRCQFLCCCYCSWLVVLCCILYINYRHFTVYFFLYLTVLFGLMLRCLVITVHHILTRFIHSSIVTFLIVSEVLTNWNTKAQTTIKTVSHGMRDWQTVGRRKLMSVLLCCFFWLNHKLM